jgi:hypothetical protein
VSLNRLLAGMEVVKCCNFLYIHLKSSGHELDNSRPNNILQYGHFKGVNKFVVMGRNVAICNMCCDGPL